MSPKAATTATARPAGVSIGAIMKQSGVSRQTIHYYVRLGLLPQPVRTSRTYALYPRESVDLLKAIKESQRLLRLSLEEIGSLIRKAKYEPRRVWSELDDLKKSESASARFAEGRPQFLTAGELLATLHPPPPDGWLEELDGLGVVGVGGNRIAADTAGLIHGIWKLWQLGVRPEDLRTVTETIEREAKLEVEAFRRTLQPGRMARSDYAQALRTLDAFDQFALFTRRGFFRSFFHAQTHRPANLFVGPNKKHVMPSETLLSEMGLNREIDRLLNGLDRSPHNRKALADLGHAYFLRSDWFHLAGVSTKILQLDPANVRATADLSRSLFYMGDVDQCIQLLERRLKLGSDPLLRFRLGQAILLQALDAGVPELLTAVRRKRQLAAEALVEARHLPGVRRWIMLDSALDNLTVSDPLQLNPPTYAELDALHREYQELPERGRSVLGRISLMTGRILAMYALYLVCRRDRHPRAEELLEALIALDPHSALSQRRTQRAGKPSPRRDTSSGRLGTAV